MPEILALAESRCTKLSQHGLHIRGPVSGHFRRQKSSLLVRTVHRLDIRGAHPFKLK